MKETITPEIAAARLDQLSHDAGFRERLFANDAEARAEWNSLIHISAGNGAPTGTPQMKAQSRLDALNNDPAWRQRRLAGDVQANAEFKGLIRTLAAETEGEAP
jgi:hypothetical protein